MTPVLEARDLCVDAHVDGVVVPAIRRLSFQLEAGRILGLVGESGAGKTMVGRAIAQMLPPGFQVISGALSFAGRDLTAVTARERRALLGREIAFIPQAPLTALNPVLTIGQQFDEHLARQGIKRSERRGRAAAMLSSVQLPDPPSLLDRYPHQLSGGMCQRVLIALAFASNPRLVIADEPTTALDVTLHARIVELIAQMQQAHGTALIFITHDLRLAARLCDEIIVMYAGRAVERGPARTVLSAPAHPYTRCLELANPSINADRRTLYLLPEQMPSLRQLAGLSGCHFAPRCPIAIEQCRHLEPLEATASANHVAACFRTGDTANISNSATSPVAATIALAPHPVLKVEGLSKLYVGSRSLFGSAADIRAVQSAAFAIDQNEFVGLVGESGSGKSTIAKLLVGLEQPSAGRIVLNGQDVTDPSPQSRRLRTSAIQMVFQDPQSALNPRRRVASIVTQAMEAGNRHATWGERLERAKTLLAEMGLSSEFAARYPAQLSGGQRQRINIARALCDVPKLLVADEIVSGLDVSIQAQLLALLARLQSEFGFAMLFISHDLAVVRHLCKRVLVMYRGEIVEQGPVEEVFANPQHAHTRALVSAV